MKNRPRRGSAHSKTRKEPPILSPGAIWAVCLSAALLIAAVIIHGGGFSDRTAENLAARDVPSALETATASAEVLTSLFAEPEPAPTPSAFDPLILVNDAHPLPEDYQPPEMILLNGLDTALFTVKEPDTYIGAVVTEALTNMLSAAHRDGLTVWQISEGYRSRAAQQAIWDQTYEKYRTVNGLSEEKALQATARRVAKPGCSEHETGLALDVTVPNAAFRTTAQCAWLSDHCWEYGFVIRYTEEKEALTGITAEPWHIRYVGREAAERMRAEDLCLEEYAAKYLR